MKTLSSHNDYVEASPIEQAFYREYDLKYDHKAGWNDGIEDKKNRTPKTLNNAVHAWGYILGYNSGYYFAS